MNDRTVALALAGALIAIVAFWAGVISCHAVADGQIAVNQAAYLGRRSIQQEAVGLGYAYWTTPGNGWHGDEGFRWGNPSQAEAVKP